MVSPRRVVISRRAGTPPSEETWPPSNRAMMGLAQTGYRAGFAGVAPTLASMASEIDGVEMSQPNFVANQVVAPSPLIFWNLYNFCNVRRLHVVCRANTIPTIRRGKRPPRPDGESIAPWLADGWPPRDPSVGGTVYRTPQVGTVTFAQTAEFNMIEPRAHAGAQSK